MGSERYRPSNGSEGDWFMTQWCEKCVRDQPSKPCKILSRTLAFNLSDKEYPSEWIHDDDGSPRCTAFADHVTPPPNIIRDKRQIGMPW